MSEDAMSNDQTSEDTYFGIVDGFEDYEELHTTETPPLLVAFFAVYVCLSIVLAIPITAWLQKNRVKNRGVVGAETEQEMVDLQNRPANTASTGDTTTEQHIQAPDPPPQNTTDFNFPSRRLSTDPPGEKSQLATEDSAEPAHSHQHYNHQQLPSLVLNNENQATLPTDPQQHQAAPDVLSSVPSAASTSRLQSRSVVRPQPTSRRHNDNMIRPLRSWDLTARPWGRSRPLGRADLVSRSIALERQSQMSEENMSHASRRSRTSWASGRGLHHPHRSMSDAASSTLDAGVVQGEADYYRQKYIRRNQRRRLSSASSVGSLMPALSPDALSPDDAADAHDIGHVNRLEDYQKPDCFRSMKWGLLSPFCRGLGRLLELSETDYETRRIVGMAIPATIDSLADPLFRIVLLAIISHYIDTNSTVAFALSTIFIRLTTEEISGAITDVETNQVKDEIAEGGANYRAGVGRCMQRAIAMQLVLGVPVLMIWYYFMDELVLWLVDEAVIADKALDYSRFIIIDYILRGITAALMLPFHLSGEGYFERYIDVLAALLTITAVAIVASNVEEDYGGPDLRDIALLQVIIGAVTMVTKVFYLTVRGMLQPYLSGLLAPLHPRALFSFFVQVLPLFLGSVLELGEWDIILLLVRNLGPPEVAAWAVVGFVWDICFSLTEGLGESAAVRVSYYLAEGFPFEAKLIASKVACLACVEGLIMSSILLVAGPNIVVLITTDSILEIIENDMIGLTALANIAMTFAQIYWSLAGSQGSYGSASATILFARWLLMIPLAAICIFPYSYDLGSLAGCISVGYATAAFALSLRVYNADWVALSRAAQEELIPLDEDDEEDLSSEDDDDGDDDGSVQF